MSMVTVQGDRLGEIFANLPKIEIADLLKFIGDKMNLWDGFNHIKPKYIKRDRKSVV